MVYKRPFWCEKNSERDIEIRFLNDCLESETPKQIIDVGFAGSGYIEMILDMGIKYTGLDGNMNRITGQSLAISETSKTQFSKARWRDILKKIDYINADILNYRTSITTDMIVSISTIEHIVLAGYGVGKFNLYNDIHAVKNMKKLSNTLVLTFPVGQQKKLRDRDIFIIDQDRLNKIVGGWNIVSEKYYLCGQDYKICSKKVALSHDHKSSKVETLCCLMIKK